MPDLYLGSVFIDGQQYLVFEMNKADMIKEAIRKYPTRGDAVIAVMSALHYQEGTHIIYAWDPIDREILTQVELSKNAFNDISSSSLYLRDARILERVNDALRRQYEWERQPLLTRLYQSLPSKRAVLTAAAGTTAVAGALLAVSKMRSR